ncbi:MAG: heme exporter protein CcmD [Methyloceanibacter sp.]|jgi:heme exporter protein D|nr:heme exporter protein CcmD [Methyloceanibacter sp.]
MPDLGPHAVFILSAYGVTFVAIAALTLAVVEDDRKQRRILADLERRGIRRRSASAPTKPKPSVPGKPARRRRP